MPCDVAFSCQFNQEKYGHCLFDFIQPYLSWTMVPSYGQFQRHFKRASLPVLSNAKDAVPFCGEPLCMSMVRLEFLALGTTNEQCICAPPDPKLRQILD